MQEKNLHRISSLWGGPLGHTRSELILWKAKNRLQLYNSYYVMCSAVGPNWLAPNKKLFSDWGAKQAPRRVLA